MNEREERNVRDLFQAAAGWKGLGDLAEFFELQRVARFCWRRARAVDLRAQQRLHELLE